MTSETQIAGDKPSEEKTIAPAPTTVVRQQQSPWRAPIAFLAIGGVLLLIAILQSPSSALRLLNVGLISAIMAMGLNLQWGYAGLFNAGVMAFAALGGLAAVVVSHAPVGEALSAGGSGLVLSAVIVMAIAVTAIYLGRVLKGGLRSFVIFAVVIVGYLFLRPVFTDAVIAVEAVDPAKTGFIGGLGMPIVFSWVVGGIFAAAIAWLIGKVALGLRSDYLAIATLGISEIVIAVLKNEEWLARGVKNVSGLERPVPYEIDLQQQQWFIDLVTRLNAGALQAVGDDAARETLLRQLTIETSTMFVQLCYLGLFSIVLLILLGLCVRALNSPWGRMMRAIRDNDEAAAAMGKDIKSRHLQVFVLGSAIIGIAGAMLVTFDGLFTPGTYIPLRFTFLIWVMVIVGGSGNNLGAVLGGILIWTIWDQAEPVGRWLVELSSAYVDPDTPLYRHLQDIAGPFRLFMMGLVLLIVMRFSPRGILPEKVRHS
ncbi:branched-chain amino acid ABC transporter permease [Oricola sp.]|uniref:branched-chain amino acid ABC transporter permease n=1 Tax=Oricola sp. TaxID=1979950 RepID=UPI003BA89053